MWFDALGHRLPPPLFPGFEHSSGLPHRLAGRATTTRGSSPPPPHHRQGVLRLRLGAEPRPNRGKSVRDVVGRADVGHARPGARLPRARGGLRAGRHHRWARAQDERADPEPLLDARTSSDRSSSATAVLDNPFCKDAQVTAIRGARAYRGDRPIRTASPHWISGPQGRAAHRGPPLRPHAQDPRRPRDRPRGRVLGEDGGQCDRPACRRRGCRVRRRGARGTARSRRPSSAAASSPADRWPRHCRHRGMHPQSPAVQPGSGCQPERHTAR